MKTLNNDNNRKIPSLHNTYLATATAAAPLGGGKGIVTVIFHTNSTGMLAPLNGVIAAGIDNISPNGESDTTLWRWESGIPLSTNTTTTTTSETNVTTTTAGATAGEEG